MNFPLNSGTLFCKGFKVTTNVELPLWQFYAGMSNLSFYFSQSRSFLVIQDIWPHVASNKCANILYIHEKYKYIFSFPFYLAQALAQ